MRLSVYPHVPTWFYLESTFSKSEVCSNNVSAKSAEINYIDMTTLHKMIYLYVWLTLDVSTEISDFFLAMDVSTEKSIITSWLNICTALLQNFLSDAINNFPDLLISLNSPTLLTLTIMEMVC